MAIQLVEGQPLAADYSLLHQLESSKTWLALYEPTQERVRISLLENCDAATAEAISAAINRYQAVVHPNLLRTYRIEHADGDYFTVAEYKKGIAPLNLSRPFDDNWPVLKQLIRALEYAHSLGFYHGAITPERLLTTPDGIPYIDGFGLPPADPGSDFLAPEIASGPGVASDIYSIAQILHQMLTGNVWTPNQSMGTIPLNESVQPLLLSMLSENPGARPEDFSSLVTLLEESRSQQHDAFTATSFERAAAATPITDPVTQQVHKLPRDRNVISMPIALGGLAILLTVAFSLFFLIPDPEVSRPLTSSPNPSAPAAETNTSQAAATPEAAAPTLAPLELAKLEELRVKGKALAAELLKRQVEVEDVGGRLWAGDRYDRSTELGIAGDEAYRQEQLQLAVDKYNEGIGLLNDVIAETDAVFDEYIEKGIAALDSGDYEAAIKAYRILTRIDPEDSQLAADLERALNLEQVLRLTSDAEVMERNGDIQSALAAFKEAANIDPDWSAAVEGVRRINNQIARNRFQDAMSTGFSALGSDDFDAATAAFKQAQKILPGSKDGLQQIELAKTQRQVQSLTEKAEQFETDNQWTDAIPIYEEILAISPGLSPAENALRRARERAELKATVEKYVAQPHLMQNDRDLTAAREALLKAARLDNDGLKGKIRDLSHLVSLARIDVEVIIESDNRTDVTVYKVGQYGKIDEARLNLIPGVYTFVGKRPGYRDVYKEVHVKGDVSPLRISVTTTEKI